MSDLLFEVSQGVGLITLNRPQVMNAFGGSLREDLLACLQAMASDPAVGCVVITGAGSAFCAGGDIANMAALQAAHELGPIAARMVTGAAVVRLLRAMPQPVIAAVNGAAAGAGLNLALACDLRYAATSAKFSASFVKIGLVPDWGGHYLLPRLVGTACALELMLSGDRIDAETALRLGLVNKILPPETLLEATLDRARALAAGPRAAMAAIKRGAYLGASSTLEATLAWEQTTQLERFLSADAREGTRAFLEKRPPHFGLGAETKP